MMATRPPVPSALEEFARIVGFVLLCFMVGCTLAVGTATAVLWIITKVMGA